MKKGKEMFKIDDMDDILDRKEVVLLTVVTTFSDTCGFCDAFSIFFYSCFM